MWVPIEPYICKNSSKNNNISKDKTSNSSNSNTINTQESAGVVPTGQNCWCLCSVSQEKMWNPKTYALHWAPWVPRLGTQAPCCCYQQLRQRLQRRHHHLGTLGLCTRKGGNRLCIACAQQLWAIALGITMATGKWGLTRLHQRTWSDIDHYQHGQLWTMLR